MSLGWEEAGYGVGWRRGRVVHEEFRAGIAKGERVAGCTAVICTCCTVSAESYSSFGF